MRSLAILTSLIENDYDWEEPTPIDWAEAAKFNFDSLDSLHLNQLELALRLGYLVPDESGLINFNGCISLWNRHLTNLPCKFGRVGGYFDCGYNKLTTLEGVPHTVDGYFNCSRNPLKALDHAPKIVNGVFYCYNTTTIFTEADIRAVCQVEGRIALKP